MHKDGFVDRVVGDQKALEQVVTGRFRKHTLEIQSARAFQLVLQITQLFVRRQLLPKLEIGLKSIALIVNVSKTGDMDANKSEQKGSKTNLTCDDEMAFR